MSATMDFFEAQADAHRVTLRLIALFVLAVAALIVLTVLAVAATLAWGEPPAGTLGVGKIFATLSPELVLGIAGVVVGVVVVASVFRLISLSRGGRAVAEALDGRLLQPASEDPAERRLLNVVEEMAIAAGLPVPPVFVLDEPGINAFAAGYGPDDAVIGVTRGTLELLDRDELQGVVAHEFSHILNGDMRMNIRLMSVLFGILVIGVIGRGLVGGRSRRHHRTGSNRRGGAQLALLGIALLLVGYVGTFFGNLIKAAVSRQRELLADASAVQFTRNPAGLAGALRKIGGHRSGSRIRDGRAEEMSHMFFGQAFSGVLGRALATHPPLDERIRVIDPSWDGRFPTVTTADPGVTAADGDTAAPDAAQMNFVDAHPAPADGATADGATARRPLPATDGRSTGAIAEAATGAVDADAVASARSLIAALPPRWQRAAHDAFGARAVIYALLVAAEDPVRVRQLAELRDGADPRVMAEVEALLAEREGVGRGARLPLVQLAAPALKTLSDAQYRRFMANLVRLIGADRRIELFEWVLHQVLLKELHPHFEGVERRTSGRRRLERLADACATVLSTVARTGHRNPVHARAAFAAAAAETGLPDLPFETEADPDLRRLTAAVRRLRTLHPLQQPRLLKGVARCILHDGEVDALEHELLRGLAAALDCPPPPLRDDLPPLAPA